MHNFEKRVVIHDGKEIPSHYIYCLVLLEDGTMQRAFWDIYWISSEDNILTKDEVKAWCYIEDLFESPKNVDIRMYIDESENSI